MAGFIAIQPIRFGDKVLQPGDEVPVEPGRNYASMLRLHQIASAVVHDASAPKRGRARRGSEDE